uniref:Protein phosphatase 1, regulatory (inhibitor) subunit 2 n=1 Tax=Tetraodon nigroviridis TaxID=99883 RepID=H3DDP3_TETNG
QRVGMAAPRPIKGILKNKNSATVVKTPPEEVEPEDPEHVPGLSEDEQRKKSQKWDEMNILATYHPADKDYGLMKIDEPNTPYNRMVGDEDDEGALSDSDGQGGLAADDLASKLVAAESAEPRFIVLKSKSSGSSVSSDTSVLVQTQKKYFQMRRKMHYNEGMNIKLARQLIASELEDEEDADEEMKDDTEETEEISVDPPQEAEVGGGGLEHRVPHE